MSITRIQLAFVLAPLLPSLFFLISLQLSGHKIIILMLLFSLPFSYLPCLLFGIPLLSILKKKNKLNMVNFFICGALLGTIVFYTFGFVFSSFLDSTKNLIPGLTELFTGAALGASVAIAFCLIAGIPFFTKENV